MGVLPVQMQIVTQISQLVLLQRTTLQLPFKLLLGMQVSSVSQHSPHQRPPPPLPASLVSPEPKPSPPPQLLPSLLPPPSTECERALARRLSPLSQFILVLTI